MKAQYTVCGKAVICSYRCFAEYSANPSKLKDLLEKIQCAAGHCVDTLVLDLEDTEYIESRAFHSALQAKSELRSAGIHRTRLLNPSESTMKNYEVCGFDYEFGEPAFHLRKAIVMWAKPSQMLAAA